MRNDPSVIKELAITEDAVHRSNSAKSKMLISSSKKSSSMKNASVRAGNKRCRLYK